jgi:hypothetical protein
MDEQVVEVLTTPKRSVVRKKLTPKKSCDAITLYELVYLFGPCICFYFRSCITFFVWTMYHFLCLDHILLSMFGPCISFYVWTMYRLRYQFLFVWSTFYVQFIQVQVVIYSSSSAQVQFIQVQVVIYSSAPYNISSGHNTSPHSSSHNTSLHSSSHSTSYST